MPLRTRGRDEKLQVQAFCLSIPGCYQKNAAISDETVKTGSFHCTGRRVEWLYVPGIRFRPHETRCSAGPIRNRTTGPPTKIISTYPNMPIRS